MISNQIDKSQQVLKWRLASSAPSSAVLIATLRSSCPERKRGERGKFICLELSPFGCWPVSQHPIKSGISHTKLPHIPPMLQSTPSLATHKTHVSFSSLFGCELIAACYGCRLSLSWIPPWNHGWVTSVVRTYFSTFEAKITADSVLSFDLERS